MSLSPGTRLGPYEILSARGAGGMGEVYRARETRLVREVAIKVLPLEVAADPERRARFEREALSVAAPQHPNICTIYDVGGATERVSFLQCRIRAVSTPCPTCSATRALPSAAGAASAALR